MPKGMAAVAMVVAAAMVGVMVAALAEATAVVSAAMAVVASAVVAVLAVVEGSVGEAMAGVTAAIMVDTVIAVDRSVWQQVCAGDTDDTVATAIEPSKTTNGAPKGVPFSVGRLADQDFGF